MPEPSLIKAPRSERLYRAAQGIAAFRGGDRLFGGVGDFPGEAGLRRGELVPITVEASRPDMCGDVPIDQPDVDLLSCHNDADKH